MGRYCELNVLSVLVIGGTRFIGKKVVRGLITKGEKVTVLSRRKILSNENLESICDERAPGLIKLKGRHFDTVIDFICFNGNGPRDVFNYTSENASLKRNVNLEELGNSALYLVSDLSSAITGEIHYVDCGFNIVGMPKN